MTQLAHREFRAMVFDMDGLMLDTEQIYYRAWARAAEELGYHMSEELLHATTGRTFADCYRLFADAYGPTFPMPDFLQRWPVHWNQIAETEGIQQKPGLAELLDWIDEQRIPKAVATSTSRPEALFTLRTGGIGERFHLITTGDEIQNGKPAPDIYLLAAQRLQVPPQQCIAFEDSLAGVFSASSAGMYTIMVPDAQTPTPEARASAAQIYPTLHEALQLLKSFWS